MFNLVVFSFNYDDKNNYNYDGNTTYIVTAPTKTISGTDYLQIKIQQNTNLIIPQGTTLDCNNVQLYFDSYNMNSNILILGNITNEHQDQDHNYHHFLDLNTGNTNVILGSHATFDYNNINTHSLICYNIFMKCILYPGCEIKTNNITSNLSNLNSYYSTIYQYNGNLFLNRYVEEKDETNRNKLVGSICEDSHIIYPINMCDNNENSKIKAEYTLQKSGKETPYDAFSTTSYFPTLYWKNTYHFYSEHLWIN